MLNFFLAPLMLAGLAAILIPPIIHLLNRRRFEVVDWGAMQFLQISETTRRRLLIEEVLLMAVRMLLIAILVLAMALPWLPSSWLGSVGPKPNRDVVLVFDESASMTYSDGGPSAHEAAKEWALRFLDELTPGDTVTIVEARQKVKAGSPTHDLDRARADIRKLEATTGGCDLPKAMKEAHEILRKNSQRPHRDVIVLTDGQRQGWADEKSLSGWDTAAGEIKKQRADIAPRITVINLDPNRPKEPPNWSLARLETSRVVASRDREVFFKTGLLLRGQTEYQKPYRLRVEIDGKPEPDSKLQAPPKANLTKEAKVELTFTHKFTTPGSHLVSVIVEPDKPPEEREKGYVVKDHLPADNRQDVAVEVLQTMPVLIVDGEDRPATQTTSRERGTDFLRKALNDPPAILVEVLPLAKFDAAALQRELSKDVPGSRPRVLILFNVPRLTPQQQDAVIAFLGNGGGVLVTLGDLVDARHYNEELYRGGEGWLPGQLGELVGDEKDPKTAATLKEKESNHPTLQAIRRSKDRSLFTALFRRWWKITVPPRSGVATTVAELSTGDSLLAERKYQAGRVLLSAVPLDDSWRTDLPRKIAFPNLIHELVYYLAGVNSTRQNLTAGQSLRYQPTIPTASATVTVQPPQGEPENFTVTQWPFQYPATQAPGVYVVKSGDETTYYVVPPDVQESNLTACSPEERDKVAKLLPMKYEAKGVDLSLAALDAKQELWLWFLVGVILLLCSEVWMTRRIALKR